MNTLFQKIFPLFKNKFVLGGAILCVVLLMTSAVLIHLKAKGEADSGKEKSIEKKNNLPVQQEKKSEMPVSKEAASHAKGLLPTLEFSYRPYGQKKNTKPFTTIIVTDLGLDSSITERAIRELPSSVVLAFSPHAKTINQWIQPSRAAGHQMLLQIASESNIDHISILTYFDGVLLISEHVPPVQRAATIRTFLEEIEDKGKCIVEGRLLFKNDLAMDNNRLAEEYGKHVPFYFVSHTLTEESIFMDKQNIFNLKGIVTFPGILVPYLIDILGKQPSQNDPFDPLQN